MAFSFCLGARKEGPCGQCWTYQGNQSHLTQAGRTGKLRKNHVCNKETELPTDILPQIKLPWAQETTEHLQNKTSGGLRSPNVAHTALWALSPSGLPPSSHMLSSIGLEEQTDPSQSIKCSSTELASDWQGCQC